MSSTATSGSSICAGAFRRRAFAEDGKARQIVASDIAVLCFGNNSCARVAVARAKTGLKVAIDRTRRSLAVLEARLALGRGRVPRSHASSRTRALEAALPADLFRWLEWRASAVVVTVPRADWVVPIKTAARKLQ